MTRQDALLTARSNHLAHWALPLGERVWMKPEEETSRFGYRHGWYHVSDYAFSLEEITGRPYDMDQGGWAWV